MTDPPCLKRLELLEAGFKESQTHQATMLAEIRESRATIERANEAIEKHALEARDLIQREAQDQREALKEVGDHATAEFAKQTASILAISSALNTVQANISKWAAGGALIGAVLLFIAVRALGF